MSVIRDSLAESRALAEAPTLGNLHPDARAQAIARADQSGRQRDSLTEYDAAGVRALLTERARFPSNQKSVAVALGVSEQYLSDVLHGRREPGDAILDGLGLERVVTYRKRTQG